MSTDQKRNVCRCLFGKPDHEGLREELNKELKLQRVSSKSEWNFDFETETPLHGRYQWVVLSDSDYTPEFYRRSLAPKKLEMKNNISPKPKDAAADCQEPKKLSKSVDSKRRSTMPQKLIQSRMDVYMKQRKRRRESEVLSSVRTPKSLRV